MFFFCFFFIFLIYFIWLFNARGIKNQFAHYGNLAINRHFLNVLVEKNVELISKMIFPQKTVYASVITDSLEINEGYGLSEMHSQCNYY